MLCSTNPLGFALIHKRVPQFAVCNRAVVTLQGGVLTGATTVSAQYRSRTTLLAAEYSGTTP